MQHESSPWPNADKPHPGERAWQPLSDDQALQVVVHLARELPDVTDQQAVVAVQVGTDGEVGLTDVTLHPNGVLTVPQDAAGIAVVTSDWVDPDPDDAGHSETADVDAGTGTGSAPGTKVRRQQLVVVRRDGSEIGAHRLAGSSQLTTWGADPAAAELADREISAAPHSPSPKDVAANTARRAMGVAAQVASPIDARDVAARIWLARVADNALQAFDTDDGPKDVAPAQLTDIARAPVVAADGLPNWPALRAAAVDGTLDLGPHTIAPDYAAWLDQVGFAQLLDELLPSITALLGTLEITGGSQLVQWARTELSTRGFDVGPGTS